MSRGPGPKLFIKLSAPQLRNEELRPEAGERKYGSPEGLTGVGQPRAGRPVAQEEQSTRAAPAKEANGSLRLL